MKLPSTNAKVLFIGLDAFDPALARRWAREGLLPNFDRLLRTGLVGETDGPPGLFVGAQWPTISTAVNPGKHGCHAWEQLRPGTYDTIRFRAGDEVERPPFWVALCRAGRRVVLLDVPLSGLTPEPNLLQVLEWGTHDPEHGFRAHPRQIGKEILDLFGLPPVQGNCNAWGRGVPEYVQFRDDLVRGVAMRTKLHRWLLDRGAWDLAFVVYSESHCVGHQTWHLHDPDYPGHDRTVAEAVGDPIRDVYQAIDASVGELLEQAGHDVTTILFASHGMTAHYDPTFLLDDVLIALEGASSADPRGRRYFQVANNQVDAGIRLNLRSREPVGLVEPGAEADGVCAQLISDLGDLVDLDTGRPIVDRVLRTRDLYHGERVDQLPDLVVQWTKGKYVNRVGSTKVGTIEREYEGVRTGDHTSRGLFAVTGPGIEAGRIPGIVDVMDFGPTFAALLGVELDDTDGRPIHELVAAGDGLAATAP